MSDQHTNQVNLIYCPHCKGPIEIIELNCRIFRHAYYKHNFTQVNPHMQKGELDVLIKTNQIYGCGRPFIVLGDESSTYTTEICDYI